MATHYHVTIGDTEGKAGDTLPPIEAKSDAEAREKALDSYQAKHNPTWVVLRVENL